MTNVFLCSPLCHVATVSIYISRNERPCRVSSIQARLVGFIVSQGFTKMFHFIIHCAACISMLIRKVMCREQMPSLFNDMCYTFIITVKSPCYARGAYYEVSGKCDAFLSFSTLLALCEGAHRSPVDSPHKGQ